MTPSWLRINRASSRHAGALPWRASQLNRARHLARTSYDIGVSEAIEMKAQASSTQIGSTWHGSNRQHDGGGLGAETR